MSTPITRHVLSLPAGSRDECTESTAVQAAGRTTGCQDGEREGENSYRVGVDGCQTVNSCTCTCLQTYCNPYPVYILSM